MAINEQEAAKTAEREPPAKTEKQVNDIMRGLVGKLVTGASFSLEDGYLIEVDDRIRFRSCGEHTVVMHRKVQ